MGGESELDGEVVRLVVIGIGRAIVLDRLVVMIQMIGGAEIEGERIVGGGVCMAVIGRIDCRVPVVGV